MQLLASSSTTSPTCSHPTCMLYMPCMQPSDPLSPILTRPYLLPSPSQLTRSTLATATFPSVFKLAQVTPLAQKAHSHRLKWETISLLPFLSKTFEGAVLKRITNFLSQSHLLDRILYDFKCGSYRNDPVVGDRGCQQKPEQPFSLPISLSDAFDAVNKLNLLSILSGACGIWIKLFVSSAIYPFFSLEG